MLPPKGWNKKGVSEVVGTILILMITVVLFSTVILWVTNLPTPTANTRLDFEGKLVPIYSGGNWAGASILLTHRGGEDLLDTPTRIYLNINGSIEVLHLKGKNFDPTTLQLNNYGISGTDNVWNIGETWSYTNHSIKPYHKISVLIVDYVKSIILWQQDIFGFPGLQPPLFIEKWTDSDPSTPSWDPIQPGDSFNLYAKVTDPDGDLKTNSVYAYFTFGPVGYYRMYDDGSNGDAVGKDGIFTHRFLVNASQSWDGGVIVLNATDALGHIAQSRFVLSVVNLGTTNIFNNGTGTGPLNLTKFNDLQRYDVFNLTQWTSRSWSATPTRTFKQGETVVVVIASKFLQNLDLSNVFTLYDTTSLTQTPIAYAAGPGCTQSPTSTTSPSSNNAFVFNSVQSGYNIFIYQFSTKSPFAGCPQLNIGNYPFTFDLKTSLVPPPKNRFYANDMISVVDSSGNGLKYPAVGTYSDLAYTKANTSFVFIQRMYVKVTVRDTDASFSIGAIEIQDYIGNVQILAAPGSSPVSTARINDTTSYTFSIDLSRPNLDKWLFGNATYTLTIRGVIDANENYNSLAIQVKIQGPRWTLDAILGTMANNHQNFGQTVYGNFYDNDHNWNIASLDTFQAAPGTSAPPNPITATTLGDMDADSDLDIVAGQDCPSSDTTKCLSQTGNKVVGKVEWFRNVDGAGNTWEKHIIDTLCPSATTSPCVTAVAVGHIDRDSLLDIAVGTSTGDIWWYSNDGFWTAHFVANVGVRVNSLKLADMNGDKISDIVVGLATAANSIRIYLNDGTGVFGSTSQTIISSNCCLMASDAGGMGTVSGTYLDTQTTNSVWEQATEGKANYSVPSSEIPGTTESVAGSYVNVTTLDNQFETLTEGVSGTTYTLGTLGNGHRYNYTNVWIAATDRVEVHIHAALIVGTEAINVRWGTSPTGPWTLLGSINSQTFGEYMFVLPSMTLNGKSLYIALLDTDQSANDGASDGILTSVEVDYAYLLISRSATGTTSAMSHLWTTQIVTASQDAYKFFVNGFHTTNSEGDDFIFRYAFTSTGPYFDLLTMNTIGSNTVLSVSMDKSVGGKALYVIVEDLDRTAGHTALDTVKIDQMYVNGYKSNPVAYNLNPGLATNSIALADMDGDGFTDIVAGLATNVVNVYWNSGTGSVYTGPQSLITPAVVTSVDVGLISGTFGSVYPDSRKDIAVGMTNTQIQGLFYGGSRAAWFSVTIFDLSSISGSTTAKKVRVGDIDGDGWDDVMVITASDNLLLEIHNKRGAGFESFILDSVGATIQDMDIGDVDRGVLANYARYF